MNGESVQCTYVPGCVGEVDPEADLDLVAPHGGEHHGGVEHVLRRHLRVVAVVERRLQRQELAADQVVRLARAVQPPPGDRTGIAAATSAGHGGLRDAGLKGGHLVNVAAVTRFGDVALPG